MCCWTFGPSSLFYSITVWRSITHRMYLKVIIVVCLAVVLRSAALMGQKCKNCNRYCACLPQMKISRKTVQDLKTHGQCLQEGNKKQEEYNQKNPPPGMPRDFFKNQRKYESCMKQNGFSMQQQPRKMKAMCPNCRKAVDMPTFFGRKKRFADEYLRRTRRSSVRGGATPPFGGGSPPSYKVFEAAANRCLAKKRLPKMNDPSWNRKRDEMGRAHFNTHKQRQECYYKHCETDKRALSDYKCRKKHMNSGSAGPMPMPLPVPAPVG